MIRSLITRGILPDREAPTVAAWLSARPSIAVIARDPGDDFRRTATDARPEAVQVADRWNFMKNGKRQRGVSRRCAALDGDDTQGRGRRCRQSAPLSSAEMRQHDGCLRCEKENTAVPDLAKDGVTMKEIVRRTWCSPGLLRQILRTSRADIL